MQTANSELSTSFFELVQLRERGKVTHSSMGRVMLQAKPGMSSCFVEDGTALFGAASTTLEHKRSVENNIVKKEKFKFNFVKEKIKQTFQMHFLFLALCSIALYPASAHPMDSPDDNESSPILPFLSMNQLRKIQIEEKLLVIATQRIEWDKEALMLLERSLYGLS
jgi:hypothetical protein